LITIKLTDLAHCSFCAIEKDYICITKINIHKIYSRVLFFRLLDMNKNATGISRFTGTRRTGTKKNDFGISKIDE
jgi:hypothetical protein